MLEIRYLKVVKVVGGSWMLLVEIKCRNGLQQQQQQQSVQNGACTFQKLCELTAVGMHTRPGCGVE